MTKVLVTGGRSPVALEIVRQFAEEGHDVYVAESIPLHLCRFSRFVRKSIRVSPPRHKPKNFISELEKLIIEEQIDLLIPTCEELFTIAQHQERLSKHCTVFVDQFDLLMKLHNKWSFMEVAKGTGIRIPETRLIESSNSIDSLPEKMSVLKPVFSRFGSQVCFLDEGDCKNIDISTNTPWVAQEFIKGKSLSAFAIAHKGKTKTEVIYPVEARAGRGAAVHFESIKNEKISAWIRNFIKKIQFTGQVGFDLIEAENGEVYLIECNPRATSGVHITDGVVDSYLDRPSEFTSKFIQPKMLLFPMLIYGWQRIGRRKWFKDLFNAKDVIFRWNDPIPFFTFPVELLYFAAQSLKLRIGILEATTHDIEWNG